MLNIDDGVRNRPKEENHPLTEALHFYADLVTHLSPQPFSGMSKLMLLQSGGVDSYSSDSPINITLSPPVWNIIGGETICKQLTRAHYPSFLIANNIKTYIDLCINLTREIIRRNSLHNPNDIQGRYFPTSNAFYASFYPSPMVLEKMARVAKQFSRMDHSNIVVRDQTTALENLHVSIFGELEVIVRQGGRGMNYLPDFHSIENFLKTVENIIRIPVWDYKPQLLPLFRSMMYLVRLMYGQVAPINYDALGNTTGYRRQDVRISDSTLAAIPAPTVSFLSTFEEPEVSMISNKGWQYIDRLTAVYSTCN